MGRSTRIASVVGGVALSLFASACSSADDAGNPAQKDDDICLAGMGDCAPPPDVACASPLGKRVAAKVFRADFGDSTVPREMAYGGRNVEEGPLVDAIQIFPKIADLIAGARYEADFESFEWGSWHYDLDRDAVREQAARLAADRTAISDSMRDPTVVILSGLVRLEDRLRREEAESRAPALPVRVNFSIDGSREGSPLGSATATSKVANLRRQLEALEIDPKYVEVHTAAHGALLAGAAHSKLVVVDGYRALITGANPQQQQTVGGSWHDAGYVVIGEAGVALQRSFDTLWASAPEVTSCSAGSNGKPACKESKPAPLAHVAAVARPDLAAAAELRDGCLPVLVATRKPSGFSGGLSTANPLSVASPQDQAFLALLEEARAVVKIESPNLNAPAVKKAILAALKRGVSVQIILSLGFNADAERKLGGSNEDTVRELYRELEGSPACGKLEVRWHSIDGKRPTWSNEVPGATHAKYMSIDGQLVMVGSANQDLASWGFAYETNVLVDDATTTRAHDASMFDADWKRAQPVQAWAAAALGAGVLKAGGERASEADLDWLLGKDRAGWLSAVSRACK